MIANTPEPPYSSTIFTSIRIEVKEIENIEGFLGYETFRDKNSFGVNVSYWKDLNALKKWKENTLHKKAQALGREKWYKNYKLRICLVERDYGFIKE